MKDLGSRRRSRLSTLEKMFVFFGRLLGKKQCYDFVNTWCSECTLRMNAFPCCHSYVLKKIPLILSSGGTIGRLYCNLSLWQHNRSIFHLMAWFSPSAACCPQAEFVPAEDCVWRASGIDQHPSVSCVDHHIVLPCLQGDITVSLVIKKILKFQSM